MVKHFWDDKVGGFFFTPDDGETLIVRKKEVYDGAVPSGNAVVMFNLLRLASLNCASQTDKFISAPRGLPWVLPIYAVTT
jgi:hypothetical protein